MSEARPHPPSAQRSAEARRAGHVPRSTVLGAWAGLAGLALGVEVLGPGFWRGLRALARASLSSPAPDMLAAPGAWLSRNLIALGSQAAGVIALMALGTLLSTLIAQGPVFAIGPARRARFPRLPLDRTAAFLAVIGVLGVVLGLAGDMLRVVPEQAGTLLERWLLRAAWVLLACALIDVALARAAHFRSLWMTRREQRDEQREAHGSPEVRRLRERLRRANARAGRP